LYRYYARLHKGVWSEFAGKITEGLLFYSAKYRFSNLLVTDQKLSEKNFLVFRSVSLGKNRNSLKKGIQKKFSKKNLQVCTEKRIVLLRNGEF
jgi:hypothetical protein